MTATASPAVLAVETTPLETVTVDIYRDIHKGIRTELFGVTAAAGAVDPGQRDAVVAVASRWHALNELLVSHAEHEDTFVQPFIEAYAPGLAVVIGPDHERLEAQMASLSTLADRATAVGRGDRRLEAHRLYLGLASFTSDYLAHQAFEELEVMPALASAMGPDEIAAVNGAIVASIPPAEAATAIALMLPAMNVEDRVEMLGGMQAGAPPEMFAGVVALAESLLAPADFRAVAARLGIV